MRTRASGGRRERRRQVVPARRGDVRDLLAEVDMTSPRGLPIVESCTRCYYCARWGTAPHYECVHPSTADRGAPWFLDDAEAESGVPQECPLRRETTR